jgi:heme exporter protein C
MKRLDWFANPNRFLRLAALVQPWAAGLTLVLAAAGLYLGLFRAPPDYQQGESVRIMYVHVPAAWMALFCYTAMAGASAIALIWKHPLADLAAKGTAPIGAGFTFLALVTGSLWGKPMWGTWWVWDARLTSVLILFFLYLGYIALNNAFDDPTRGAKASAILALVGFVNVPIIKFSVDWWNTLHQPASVFRAGGPTIHPSMLAPLLLMGLAFTSYYLWVLLIRVRAEILANKVRAHRLRQVRTQPAPVTAMPATGKAEP